MENAQETSKLKAFLKTKSKWIFLGLIAIGALAGGVLFVTSSGYKAPTTAAHSETGHESELGHSEANHNDAHHEPLNLFSPSTYVHAVQNIRNKLALWQKLDLENHRLKLENAQLRLWTEDLKYECSRAEAKVQTQSMGYQLTEETGSNVGRVLASINYHPPSHLLPPQLYTLGLSYFKAEDFEKAAVLFTYVTGLYNSNQFKNPKDYLFAGMAWYYLQHYKLAQYYYQKAINVPVDANDNPDALEYQAKARLAYALSYEKMKDRHQSQVWMLQVVDYHPHSEEASWINPGERVKINKRVPANDHKPQRKPDSHHSNSDESGHSAKSAEPAKSVEHHGEDHGSPEAHHH